MQKCTRTYFTRSGSLTVKELDKYTDHHHFQCKYLSKKNTIQSTAHHYYNTTGVEKQQSEDSVLGNFVALIKIAYIYKIRK